MTPAFCLLMLFAGARALRVGAGIADVTGPPVEIGFGGYENFAQIGQGIHLRQFSRAFVLADDSRTSTERLVFVSADIVLIAHGVRKAVIKLLQERFGEIYSEKNVILSGTHTHSGTGGFAMDFLYDLSTLGFAKETYDAYVTGIYTSIVRAHNNLTPARVEYGEGEVLGANINRSPTSYLRNPPEERAKYKYNTDKTLSQVKFIAEDKSIIGVINWFAVHPTSMNNTNKLISSDNIGYASILMEKAINGKNTLPGKGRIVCAFASTNLGDVSPNTRGPRCSISGKVCDQEFLLCEPNEQCFASGPGRDMFESTRIIATKIFETAMEVFNQPGEDVTGPVGAVHQFVDMPKQTVWPFDPVSETFNTSALVSGCVSAMGYSYAAGTTDGAALSGFRQGTLESNPMLNGIRDLIAKPTEADIKCHAPKPILLATGRAQFPYEFQPHVVSCMVARIGGLIIAAVPGEFTTMSGRRLRNVVGKIAGCKKVVLAGLSNIYASYIATPQEYQEQRYEGASTMFGPHTLDIYLNKYVELTEALMGNETPKPGPQPPDFSKQLITSIPPVLCDTAQFGKQFGDCIKQPERQYSCGDIASAYFVSGNPRNDLRHGSWYGTVEKLESAEDDAWTVVATDADWETKFFWYQDSKLLGTSHAEIQWHIPSGTPPGTYRLHHYGNYKNSFGGIYPYHGFSNSFEVKHTNEMIYYVLI